MLYRAGLLFTLEPGSPFPLLTFVCLFVCCLFRVGTHATVCSWSSEGNLQELVASFQDAGSGNQTQIMRFESRYLHPLRHLADSGPWPLNALDEGMGSINA